MKMAQMNVVIFWGGIELSQQKAATFRISLASWPRDTPGNRRAELDVPPTQRQVRSYHSGNPRDLWHKGKERKCSLIGFLMS